MAFQTALNTVLNWSEYDEGNQEVFNHSLLEFDLLTETKLSISERERNHIVSIFNAKGGIGRWFKCKNGHIYVITECGGPTQVSKCPECNESIGGYSHRLLPESEVANEM